MLAIVWPARTLLFPDEEIEADWAKIIDLEVIKAGHFKCPVFPSPPMTDHCLAQVPFNENDINIELGKVKCNGDKKWCEENVIENSAKLCRAIKFVDK